MFSGLKALGSWMRAHPAWAVIVFAVLIPVVLYGVVAWLRNLVVGLPVVGPVIAKGAVTDNLAPMQGA